MRRSRRELTIGLDEVFCNLCDVQMIWRNADREWVCPECGNEAYQDDTCGPDEVIYEQVPDDWIDDEDDEEDPFSVPEGCRACGGDYPDCRSGCAMFDDD